jgi:hypothetical protein
VHFQHIFTDTLQLFQRRPALLVFVVVDLARFGNTIVLHRSCGASRLSAARTLPGSGGRVWPEDDLKQE